MSKIEPTTDKTAVTEAQLAGRSDDVTALTGNPTGEPQSKAGLAAELSGKPRKMKTESMTAAEAQQAWLGLKVQDGGSNPGNQFEVNGKAIIQAVRSYAGVTFVPVIGGQVDTFVLSPSETVSVKMPARDDLNATNANGELDG